MSSGRCRWALIYLAFGTLTSINNFAAVTASKAGKIESLDEECMTDTKRQIEIYQWLLRQNGFTVSDTGIGCMRTLASIRPLLTAN